jgi:hypothetical protein
MSYPFRWDADDTFRMIDNNEGMGFRFNMFGAVDLDVPSSARVHAVVGPSEFEDIYRQKTQADHCV